MARASFTLKRYLPLNTETQSQSDWAVYGGNPASGASGTGASVTAASAGLFGYAGGESFDIIIRARSPKWVPDSNTNGLQVLCWSGTLGSNQSFLWYINDPSAANGPSGFEVQIDANSQFGKVCSNPIPFSDGETYWIKFHFDHLALTGSFYYASDSETEPTSWTPLSNSYTTLSNLTSFVSLDNHADTTLGFYDPDTNLADNNFNGSIYRAIIRTYVGEVTEYFYYTGASVGWTVPEGVTSIEALLWGGGRTGGQVYGTLSVTPEEVLRLRVGGENNGRLGGWPNGGTGGANTYFNSYSDGGCGSSDIFVGTTPLMVAGGKGGNQPSRVTDPADSTVSAYYGAGGGAGTTTAYTATKDLPNGCDGHSTSYGGRGGNQSSGGAAGNSSTSRTWITYQPTAGTYGQGGNGASTNATFTGGTSPNFYNASSGGGGGGYYGGGGGGIYYSTNNDATSSKLGYSGGGGSSYVDTSRCSNYKFSVRPFGTWLAGTQSWRAAGPYTFSNATSFSYVPLIVTNTTNGTTATTVNGPPQPDYDLNAYEGLIALRYTN